MALHLFFCDTAKVLASKISHIVSNMDCALHDLCPTPVHPVECIGIVPCCKLGVVYFYSFGVGPFVDFL